MVHDGVVDIANVARIHTVLSRGRGYGPEERERMTLPARVIAGRRGRTMAHYGGMNASRLAAHFSLVLVACTAANPP